jgi:hypothetical protein
VGNKIDMRNEPDAPDCVTTEEGGAFADGQGASFVETSCKSEDGIDTLLQVIGDLAYKNRVETKDAAAQAIIAEPRSGGKKDCAC